MAKRPPSLLEEYARAKKQYEQKEKAQIIAKQAFYALLSSVPGVLLSLLVRDSIPPLFIIMFTASIPSTYYMLKKESIATESSKTTFFIIFAFFHCFNMVIGVGAFIALALLPLGGILHLLGLPFSTYSSYLLGTP